MANFFRNIGNAFVNSFDNDLEKVKRFKYTAPAMRIADSLASEFSPGYNRAKRLISQVTGSTVRPGASIAPTGRTTLAAAAKAQSIANFSTATSVTSRGMASDIDRNLKIKRRIKKKGVSSNIYRHIVNLIAPPLTLSGKYKPDAFNDYSNPWNDGFRLVEQNSQDLFQLVHMSFAEFGQLFKKGLTNPKAIPLVQNYNDNAVYDNVTDVFNATPVIDNVPGTENNNVEVIAGSTDIEDWWKNENYELLVKSYIVNYQLTNMSEHPLYFEFVELSPKQVICDHIKITEWVGGGLDEATRGITQTEFNDPLACLRRDCQRLNDLQSVDYGLDGKVQGNSVYPAATNNISELYRGISPSDPRFRELHHKYAIITKRIVQVNPGNHVVYTFTINGFQRHANWQYAMSPFQVQLLNTAGFKAEHVPTWIKQTKFLMIRAWCPDHVYSVDDGVEKLAFASARYTISAERSMSIRSLPRAKTGRHIYFKTWSDPTLDPDVGEGDTIQPTLGDSTELDNDIVQNNINPEDNQPNTSDLMNI